MCGFRNAWAVLIRQLFDAVKLISVYHIEKNSIISVIKISGILSYDEWSKIPTYPEKQKKPSQRGFIEKPKKRYVNLSKIKNLYLNITLRAVVVGRLLFIPYWAILATKKLRSEVS